ncbi:MAG: NrsF family protein [Devosia sp.]
MKTEDLIASLASQARSRKASPMLWLAGLTLSAVLVAVLALVGTIGVRPDFGIAISSWRFDYKFVVTLALALSAFVVVRAGLYPESSARLPLWVLLAGPGLLLAGVIAELLSLPGGAYAMSAVGKNAMLCLTVIPALGIAPLVLLLAALRQGAPTRPGLAGMCAGLLAGGISATLYAANCTDDSPLFVATWYPIGIAGLAIAGGLLGRIVARW